MVRFLHTSDWQLGMTRHYLAPEAQARFTADRIDAVRSIGDLARRVGAQFVVVAGDVFEHANLPDADLARAAGAISEMGVPVHLLPGNHDHTGPGSVWERDAWARNLPSNAHVLDTPGIHPVDDEVEIVAAPWVGKHPENDPVSTVLEGLSPSGRLRVLVGHGMLEGVTFSDEEDSSSVRRDRLDEALEAGLIHYVALGDRHIAWPPGHPGRIHYSGTHESTSFREPGAGTVLEVELTDHEVRVTEHVIGRWLHTTIDREIAGDADIDQLEAHLATMPDKERTIVRHALRGTLSLTQSARLDELLDRYSTVFATLMRWDRHTELVVVPSGTDLADLPVGGYVRSAALDLAERADGGDRTAVEALKLLHRFVAGAR